MTEAGDDKPKTVVGSEFQAPAGRAEAANLGNCATIYGLRITGHGVYINVDKTNDQSLSTPRNIY